MQLDAALLSKALPRSLPRHGPQARQDSRKASNLRVEGQVPDETEIDAEKWIEKMNSVEIG